MNSTAGATVLERIRQTPVARAAGGSDSSARTVVVGLAVLWGILTLANPRFLTAGNLTNMTLQIAAVSVIAIGAALVLLLAEVDLSMGSVSGLAAAVMGDLSANHGLQSYLAIAAALGVGLGIGLLHGFIITRFGVPSFVVTLGGLLAWQGAQWWVLGEGNINITDQAIINLAGTYMPDAVAWLLTAAAVVALGVVRLNHRLVRTAAGLPVRPAVVDVAGLAGYVALLVGATAVFVSARGVPLVVVIVIGLCALTDYVLRRRPGGRHVYAVGSNAEAARRAGVAVNRVRMVTFAAASTLAACGGVLAASRLYAVNQSTGGGSLLLLAIAAAVIGGVSLFGGVGSVWHALLGAVIVGSIANGMDLLAIPSSLRFMVTGGVLILAVVIDATARRRRAARGR